MFNLFYYINPSYSFKKEIIRAVETEREAYRECMFFNQDGGYEDDDGERHYVDYEEVGEKEND